MIAPGDIIDMQRTLGLFALVLACLAFGACPAHAEYDIFMQITGITGESTDANHRGWIDVLSFSHGLSNPGAGVLGAGGSKVSHADFVLAKTLDKSTLPLFLKVNQGTRTETVVVEFQKSGNNPVVFYRVTLSDAVVTSVSTQGSAGGNAVFDSLSIAYKKIAWEYWPIDASGKAGPVVRSEWDLTTNTGK
jgi:type VI secretion system secreted protein Hcp